MYVHQPNNSRLDVDFFQILFNIHQLLHDSDIWESPDDFRPERFIDEAGKVTQPKEWIPFSLGNATVQIEY